ncbi:FeoA family protein [Arcobacter sp. CECT 8985]|uniref:FeoA family protein n=1 Tax=Arcobacter sp. CECT 8985 TaxID=1935424 RepID=UPI00100AFE08|nr:FeoA family protein [Arcobacter sp. CECT 8985]RXJ87969.1 iron transporter [Arcobacter sp. CECT 8985]
MRLSELNKGEEATILALNCDSSLKNRFYSFGLTKNTKVIIEEVTLAKNTIEVRINTTKIAIRLTEANKIEVTK